MIDFKQKSQKVDSDRTHVYRQLKKLLPNTYIFKHTISTKSTIYHLSALAKQMRQRERSRHGNFCNVRVLMNAATLKYGGGKFRARNASTAASMWPQLQGSFRVQLAYSYQPNAIAFKGYFIFIIIKKLKTQKVNTIRKEETSTQFSTLLIVRTEQKTRVLKQVF